MKYSVDEIDRMRLAIIRRGERPLPNIGGSAQDLGENKRSWEKAIEERLRSYMVAGVPVNEIEAAPILEPCYRDGKAIRSLRSTGGEYSKEELADIFEHHWPDFKQPFCQRGQNG